ncbi:MAG: apolipoprotein N-acyltransferase [Pseudomonadota bacterium]
MPFAIVLLAGLAHALSVAWPFAWGLTAGQPVWWLQMVALAVLVWQLQRAPTWKRAGLLGWTFGTAMLVGTFWWLYISMHTYGGLAPVLTVLAVLGLAVFLASYYAAAGAVFGLLFSRSRARLLWRALVFAALWTLAELARNTLFTGFPWGAGGYAHITGPLAGWLPVLGVLGTGGLAVLLAATVGLWRGALWKEAVALVLVASVLTFALPWLAGTSASAGKLSVTLLQGNIPQDEKFQPGSGVPLALRWYGDQLLAASTSLVVGPETAVPLLPDDLPPGYWDALRSRFNQAGRAALLGIPLGSLQAGYTNSVVGLKPDQATVYQYDKHHLVPFGEFIPFGFRWFTSLMNIPLGDFNRGAVGQPSFDWQGQRLAPNICYEDLFGEELGARFIDPATAPTIFVNVSNIGWFGDSVAIDQHLLISRARAIEFQRPFVRATNTGATVIINHRGEVTHALPRLTRGVLVGEVEGRTGTTPFAWWVARFGLWPLAGLCLLLVAAALVLRRRR